MSKASNKLASGLRKVKAQPAVSERKTPAPAAPSPATPARPAPATGFEHPARIWPD